VGFRRHHAHERPGQQPGFRLVAHASPRRDARDTEACLAGNDNYGAAVFSPDGRLVAYHSTETGSGEVYVMPWAQGAAAGQPIQGFQGRGQGSDLEPGREAALLFQPGKADVGHDIDQPRLSASVPALAWDLVALRIAPNTAGSSLFDILPTAGWSRSSRARRSRP